VKALIAISTCERDANNGFNEAIRKTWINDLHAVEGLDYRLFYGRCQKRLLPDEVWLDIPDDYFGLPYKTRESLRWALDHGYDYIFRAFTDTCIHPLRLKTCGFPQHDYFGCFPGGVGDGPNEQGWYGYASGGPGYWLSRRAAIAVIQSEPDRTIRDDYWAEDLWVGDVVGRAGFKGQHDERFFFKWCGFPVGAVSVHLSQGTDVYRPEWMHQCYSQLRTH
jgi:hypothetical protein